MDTRREFIRKAGFLSGGAGLMHILPPSLVKALSIDPAPGTSWMDAEHIVLLMQENRSFDHAYGTLQGVRGFNDPRAIQLPNKNVVWLQSNKEGETCAPFHLDIKDSKATWMNSLPHAWSNQVDARNGGKYDKWLDSKHSGQEEYAAMPLTMGYYNRKDIPFYYALADAFTICDQHFCSSLTGTTPNRLFFWSGTIREEQHGDSPAKVWNEDADYEPMVGWKTFPERLEEAGISWTVYQNELSVGVGFEGEEDPWLANFGDNPLEFFKQYQVKLSREYIAHLPKAKTNLEEEITNREQSLSGLTPGSLEAKKIQDELKRLRKWLNTIIHDQGFYTNEKYDRLSQQEKNIHDKAFSTNRKDPDYHQLSSLTYHDGSVEREMKVPKGDILHQFRDDVKSGNLPTVSWLVAPEHYSDHPSSAWYGAWYISEVLDILTQNPEVWKKTIFILTYDENDGYFDHVPPFVAPHPQKSGTGLSSGEIKTDVDYVLMNQQSIPEHARECAIGLGYRVPLVIASPWTRGGWVCSQVFDHTSTLQFLEKFLTKKSGKKIEEPNVSTWRRAVCGDLLSVFRPWNGEKITMPAFVQRDSFIEGIHQSQFRKLPNDYKALSSAEIAEINSNTRQSNMLPVQEKGTRPSCALPYELYVEGKMNDDKESFDIQFKVGREVFKEGSAGSPFIVYAPGVYRQESVRTWDYAVLPGDQLSDKWPIRDFENENYHLRVYGPNGFFREFIGNADDPAIELSCQYEPGRSGSKRLSGNIVFKLKNLDNPTHFVEITDNSYKAPVRNVTLTQAGSKDGELGLQLNLSRSSGWYDFTVRIKGNSLFERRYAGRVETGEHGKTDPFMGRVV